MAQSRILLIFLLYFLYVLSATAFQSLRTIVVHDDLNDHYLYSNFFDDLRRSGHFVTVQHSGEQLVLESYGDLLYNNLILFSPQIRSTPLMTVHSILSFSSRGGNVIAAVDGTLCNQCLVHELALACGVEFYPASMVVDHFSFFKPLDTRYGLINST